MLETYPTCTECGMRYSTLKGSPITCDCRECEKCGMMNPPSEYPKDSYICRRCTYPDDKQTSD